MASKKYEWEKIQYSNDLFDWNLNNSNNMYILISNTSTQVQGVQNKVRNVYALNLLTIGI